MKNKRREPPPYLDIAALEEDKRIGMIGRTAIQQKKIVGFITDDEPGKPERYIRKLTERFPGIVIIGRWQGPILGVVSVKVGPPGSKPE